MIAVSVAMNPVLEGSIDGSECGPENAVIAVLAGFDCRPLVRHEVA